MDQWVESATSIRTFLECQKKHEFAYVRRRRPRAVARHLTVGVAFHRLSEAYWAAKVAGAGTPDGGRAAAVGALADARDEALATPGLDPFDGGMVLALAAGYVRAWELAPEGQAVGVEERFSLPAAAIAPGSPEAVTIVGAFDLVIETEFHRHKIVEHKTTSDAGPGYFERLRLDTQLAVYGAAARALGYDLAGLLYDVVQKPALRPLKATPEASRRYVKDRETKQMRLDSRQREADETPEAYAERVAGDVEARPDAYFKRYELTHLAAQDKQTKRDLAVVLRQVGHARLYGATRNPGACFAHGAACPYFDVCTGLVDLADDQRFADAGAHDDAPRAPAAGAERPDE